MAEYDEATPLEYLANYRDGVDTVSYRLISASSGCGARRPVDVDIGVTGTYATGTGKLMPHPSSVLSYDMSGSVPGGKYRSPRGSFVAKRVYSGIGVAPVVGDATVYVGVGLIERV